MNIDNWIKTYTTIFRDSKKIKIRVDGDKMFHKNLSNYIYENGIQYVDISNCNLRQFPSFILEISKFIKGIILNDNKIDQIPNIFMDHDLRNLEILEIKNNPISIKKPIFRDSSDLIKNILSKENKEYRRKFYKKYINFSGQTNDNIKRYMEQLSNDASIDGYDFKFNNTNNLNVLVELHKKYNIENYDFINRNIFHKFIFKSILNFLFQSENDPVKNYIKSIDSNDILELSTNLSNVFKDNNLKKKYINLIQNIFLSEFLYNDENAVRFLASGSYNKAYEVSEELNLYIIKQLMSSINANKYEPYKEFLISTFIMYYVGNLIPNFTDPICIFNLNSNEIREYVEYDNTTEEKSTYPKYLCDYDEKYYFSSSQYIFNKKNKKFDRKTFFNEPSSKIKIENNLMTRNVEYGISLFDYLEKNYSKSTIELNSKILNIIIQIIRGISLAYCKVGFYHGDGHNGNILINNLDSPTYIQEFYKNPFYAYTYHKTKEVVTFIDYGMSNLYFDKLDKLNKNNILSYVNIESHNEMCNPIVDIHRIYYSILDKLYTDYSLPKFSNKDNIMYIIKLVYIYLGGFYYEDKRVQINISNDELKKIINNDINIKYDRKKYDFFNYDKLNYGYLPVYINGTQRDNINNCFDLFNYFFSQYKSNLSQISILSEDCKFTDEFDQQFIDTLIENSEVIDDTFKNVDEFEDNNSKIIRDNILYGKNTALNQNAKYGEYIEKLIIDNTKSIEFIEQNMKSINTSLDINGNKIKNNEREITTCFVYIVKAVSIYILNLKKLCFYNILNYFSNKVKINISYIDPSKLFNLINNFLRRFNMIKIPNNSKLNSYYVMLNDLSIVLKTSNIQKLNKPVTIGQNFTNDVLSRKSVAELKDILNNLRKDHENLFQNYAISKKITISKFIKKNYIECIIYIIQNS